ncbi:MAG: hypothetical protein JW795_06595 [Chitinivibrionales bacterium]|nr:hypothetical protein [Chitinivibrionales bacterium]
MALQEEFKQQGSWLFRWRSFLPLGLAPIIAFAFPQAVALEKKIPFFYTQLFDFGCFCVSFLGLVFRALTIGFVHTGTSGSNTQTQKAVELNTAGTYSIVRHPLYLGNFLISIGIILSIKVWWLVIIFILLFWLYYERIMFCEEDSLRVKFGSVYTDWAGATPAFLPRFKLWRKPLKAFSWKKVFARDYIGLFELIVLFYCIVIIKKFFVTGVINPGLLWNLLGIGGAVFFIIVRYLKKKTHSLDVAE